MREMVLVDHIWLTTAAWVVLYASDYYTTIYAAHLYRAGVSEHLVFEGSLELTPIFQQDVDRLRRISPRFLARLALSVLAIWSLWWVGGQWLGLREVPLLLFGGLVLREAVVHLRHLRNIALFRSALEPSALRGRLEYARWVTLRQSATELSAFAAFFLLLAGVLGSWLCLGGALACAVTGQQHWTLARRARMPAIQA